MAVAPSTFLIVNPGPVISSNLCWLELLVELVRRHGRKIAPVGALISAPVSADKRTGLRRNAALLEQQRGGGRPGAVVCDPTPQRPRPNATHRTRLLDGNIEGPFPGQRSHNESFATLRRAKPCGARSDHILM